MSLKHSNNIIKENVKAGLKTTRQVLISSSEAPNFAMRKFIIEPGGSMPLHFNSVEHEQYVLKGKAEVQIGDEILTVKKDDIVYIPAGVKHNYKTVGEEAFEFLCVIPNNEDKITII